MSKADVEPTDTAQPRAATVAVLSEGFFSSLSFGIVAFALPLYAREMGLSFAAISVLISLNLAISMLLKPFVGRLVDQLGYRGSAVLSVALRTLFCLLFGAATAAWQLFSLQSARGVAKAIRDPAIHSLLAVHAKRNRVASRFAWYFTAKGAASSLGHAVAGLLLTLTAGAYGWVFVVAAALSALPLLLLPWVSPAAAQSPAEAHSRLEAAPTATRATTAAAVTGRLSGEDGLPVDARPQASAPDRLAPYIGFGFVVATTSGMLRRIMPLLLVEYAGLSAAAAGSLYLLATVVTLLVTPVFGWLYDHVSQKLVLMMRSALNASSSLIYILSPTFAGFALAKMLDKSGTAAFRPAWGALMAAVASRDPGRRAERIARMSAGKDAGTICGPVIAGILWSAFGPVAMLASRIALAVIAEAYTLLLMRWMTRRNRDVRPAASPAVASGEPT